MLSHHTAQGIESMITFPLPHDFAPLTPNPGAMRCIACNAPIDHTKGDLCAYCGESIVDYNDDIRFPHPIKQGWFYDAVHNKPL